MRALKFICTQSKSTNGLARFTLADSRAAVHGSANENKRDEQTGG
jgi:hypothetical protein